MLLDVRDIKVHYGKVEAVKDVSLQVEEGDIVTLTQGEEAKSWQPEMMMVL